MRCTKRRRSHKIIGHLRDDAGPVDRIDAGEMKAVAEGMVIEHRLHQRLTIIEIAADGKRADIALGWRRHHAPLHIGHAPLGEEDYHIRALTAPERLHRRAARIAGGRADNGDAFAP